MTSGKVKILKLKVPLGEVSGKKVKMILRIRKPLKLHLQRTGIGVWMVENKEEFWNQVDLNCNLVPGKLEAEEGRKGSEEEEEEEEAAHQQRLLAENLLNTARELWHKDNEKTKEKEASRRQIEMENMMEIVKFQWRMEARKRRAEIMRRRFEEELLSMEEERKEAEAKRLKEQEKLRKGEDKVKLLLIRRKQQVLENIMRIRAKYMRGGACYLAFSKQREFYENFAQKYDLRWLFLPKLAIPKVNTFRNCNNSSKSRQIERVRETGINTNNKLSPTHVDYDDLDIDVLIITADDSQSFLLSPKSVR